MLGEGGNDYLFLVADLNGNGDLYDNGQDGVSPKTSSAVTTPVPEPTTVLLLGIGLAGLAGGVARRKWKKKVVGNSQVIVYQNCLIIHTPIFFTY